MADRDGEMSTGADMRADRPGVRWGWIQRVLSTAVAVAAQLALVAGVASAQEPPPLFWQKCERGGAAGDCNAPRGIAVDGRPGHGEVFVADQANARIDEFTIWGQFVKAWGWGVRTGAAELQTCTASTGCRPGLAGDARGQINGPQGLAVDGAGDLYVYELANHRVQSFDPGEPADDASFLLMFGGEVNQTKSAEGAPGPERNICGPTGTDVCRAGATGSAGGEFGAGMPASSYIATGPGDDVYVGDQGRIEVFAADGEYQREIAIPGKTVYALAVDSSGDVYISYASGLESPPYSPVEEDVEALDSTGSPVCTAESESPRALAVDPSGDLYVMAGGWPPSLGTAAIHKFGPGCVEDPAFTFDPDVQDSAQSKFGYSTGLAVSAGCGLTNDDVYVSKLAQDPSEDIWVKAFGPHPPIDTCGPPPSVAPTVAAQYATSVSAASAEVGAEINPHFWSDTTYYVEYGTGDCRQAGACQSTVLYPGKGFDADDDAPAKTETVQLGGLQPGTTYHFRFVARSGGGGPAYGVVPEGGGTEGATKEAGLSGTFTTYPASMLAPQRCPNRQYRTGLGARLPHCRAFEMVSPIDKQGGDIIGISGSSAEIAALDQSSASGERLTYSSYRAFADPKSAPYASQYLAQRGASGWSVESLSPAQSGPLFGELLDNNFKAFDEELCNGWLFWQKEPLLTPDAVPGYINLYQRHNCGAEAGTYTAMTRTSPTYDDGSGPVPVPPVKFKPAISGFANDGSHVIFEAMGDLAGNPASCEAEICTSQVFDYHDGTVSPICVEPNGTPVTKTCRVGSLLLTASPYFSRLSSVFHAVSSDGSRVFWTKPPAAHPGTVTGELFVRIGNAETRRITSQPAIFYTAAADGSRVIYSVPPPSGAEGGALYEYEVDTGKKRVIAEGLDGVMGASEDGEEVYFASSHVLTGAPNGEGDVAQAGKPNLYLHVAGSSGPVFIATLAESDLNTVEAPMNLEPSKRTSRVTPDGKFAVFTSDEALTGAENRNVADGVPVSEVFLYSATANRLRCVSCNPSNARPVGREILSKGAAGTGLWEGGSIPGWPDQFHPSRVISADGSRVFFDSTERLLPDDENAAMDVYEWDAGNSQAECEAIGAQAYLAREGGCLSLITAGSGEGDAEFVDADESGRNLFVRSLSSFVPQDPGQIDIYDVREGGGFPSPEASRSCEGQACQAYPGVSTAPDTNSGTAGPGNAHPRPHRCGKGRHRQKKKGKVRCVRRAKRHAHRKRRGHRRHHHKPHAHRHAADRRGGNR